MKTLRQLAEMVKQNEAEQSPGSETGLLGIFVAQYDTVGACQDEPLCNAPVSDDEYAAWEDVYQLQARYEADGRDYTIWDLF